jgi:Glycosyl transferase family group 2
LLTICKHFYNFPQNDPLNQAQRIFVRFQEFLKDMSGFAWCTGSGWVMRRQALDSIGGFATSSVTEDIYTTMLLMVAGWKSAYIPEALQHGLMPETYKGHVKQWTRWVSYNSLYILGAKLTIFQEHRGCSICTSPSLLHTQKSCRSAYNIPEDSGHAQRIYGISSDILDPCHDRLPNLSL